MNKSLDFNPLRVSFNTAYRIPKGELARLPPQEVASLKNKVKRISFIDDE